MFGSFWLPVVCRRACVLSMLLCVFAYSGVLHTLCCVFCFVRLRLVCPMLPVSLDCPFLTATSVFSNIYLRLFRKVVVSIKFDIYVFIT